MKLMLDTNVLLQICLPGKHGDAKEWFRRLLLASSPPQLLVSVLADFELRRALHRLGAARSLEHLDELLKSVSLVSVSAEATRRASTLSSLSSAATQSRLSDADAIIAAQALIEGAVLVTPDVALRAVPNLEARDWNEIDPSSFAPDKPVAGHA